MNVNNGLDRTSGNLAIARCAPSIRLDVRAVSKRTSSGGQIVIALVVDARRKRHENQSDGISFELISDFNSESITSAITRGKTGTRTSRCSITRDLDSFGPAN